MRIFLALLVALLITDTITGASTRRGKKRGKKPRKKSSSSGKLLKSLSKKLDNLAQAEANRDNVIEDKMDQAVKDLKQSVAKMHANLNSFIEDDTAVSSSMKDQIEGMSEQVSQLSDTVMEAIPKIRKMIQSQIGNVADHVDDISGHDDHDMESMQEVVSEADKRRRARNPMLETTAEENMEGSVDPPDVEGTGSGVGSGEGEDDDAAPVAIQDPTVETPTYQNSQYEDDDGSGAEGSGNEGGFGDYVFGDDYDA